MMKEDIKRQLKNNLNPRGMTWVNDESKKCQKMMEKFGWEKGKGLGRKEDGIKENIRANGNLGKKGLGRTARSRDTVLFVQDEYSSILAGLNEMYGAKEEDKKKPTTFVDLEENCKKSTSRVYYSKFVHGKNLANKSQKDLDCILGRNRKNDEPKEEEPIKEEEETKNPQIDDQSQNSNKSTADLLQTQTVNMYAYFAEKMAARNKAAALRQSSDDQSQKSDENSTTNIDEVSNTTTHDEDTQTTSTMEIQIDDVEPPKPKKSKKRKHLSDSEEVPTGEMKKKKTCEVEEEEVVEPKNKRRKLEKLHEIIPVDETVLAEKDNQKPLRKAKKSKKKHSEVNEEVKVEGDPIVEEVKVGEVPIVEEVKRKKKHSEVEVAVKEESASEERKKKKKKKKSRDE